jgi:hypothetical protein
MVRPGTRSLLDLPAELRLRIYNCFIPENPLQVPTEEFAGLLYSCKHIHSELEPIVCKDIAGSVHDIAKNIRDRGDDIVYAPPTTFHGWLKHTVYCPNTTDLFFFRDLFWEFRAFHFNAFTIAFHDDENSYEPRLERQGQGTRITYQLVAHIIERRIGFFCEYASVDNDEEVGPGLERVFSADHGTSK